MAARKYELQHWYIYWYVRNHSQIYYSGWAYKTELELHRKLTHQIKPNILFAARFSQVNQKRMQRRNRFLRDDPAKQEMIWNWTRINRTSRAETRLCLLFEPISVECWVSFAAKPSGANLIKERGRLSTLVLLNRESRKWRSKPKHVDWRDQPNWSTRIEVGGNAIMLFGA